MANPLRILFLVLLSLVLIILTVAASFAYSLDTTVLKPYQTIEYINQSGIYHSIEEVIQKQANKEINDIKLEETRTIMSKVTDDILSETVTEEWIQKKVDFIQTSIWDYIVGKTDYIPSLPMDDFYNSILDYTDKEIKSITSEKGLPIDGVLKDEINKEIMKNVPKNLDYMNSANLSLSDLEWIRAEYQDIRQDLKYLIIALAMIIFVGLLVAFSLKRFFKWLGITFLLSGIITAIPALIKFINIHSFIPSFGLGELESLKQGVLSVFELMIQDFANQLLSYSLILFVVGLLSLFVSIFVKGSTIGKRESI